MNKPMRARIATFLAALMVCAVGILSGAHAQSYDIVYSASNPIPEIAARVRPAVVQVISMREYWSRETGAQMIEAGYGSGVYIDDEGYVVTNYHVVSDADSVDIVTLSGTRVTAESVWYDDSTDIALLRLPAPLDAEPVPMGDSDTVVIGELAIVIGNPGLSDSVFFGTVSAGIVSGLDRSGANAGNFTRTVHTIQVDAAINSGNSGGALLNSRGELIGMPTLKVGSEAGSTYEGLGFCIPVNTIREIVEELKDHGAVRRPRMGVLISEIEGPDLPIPGYPPAGLQVLEIEENTPAASSGLMLYDIITHANGTRVSTFTDLSDITDQMNAGDILYVNVYRCYDAQTGEWLAQPQELSFEIELKILD